jgi:D-serine deaminase-like pyridoxal phosphate-dependent protein
MGISPAGIEASRRNGPQQAEFYPVKWKHGSKMANTKDYKYELDTPCLTIDVGLARTGVLPESAPKLAGHIANSCNLRLKGIQAYAGFVQHIRSYPERNKASLECMQGAADLFCNLKEKERGCTIFSSTGTGTYDIDIQIPEFTELQVGSYAVMDAEYLNIAAKDDPARFSDFQPALTLPTTVVSVNNPEFESV